MKYFYCWLLALSCISALSAQGGPHSAGVGQGGGAAKERFFAADDPNIMYMGRIDFSDPKAPRFWASGVTVRIYFKGRHCRVILRDQVPDEKTHNYVGVIIDNHPATRLKLQGQNDTLEIWGDGRVTLGTAEADGVDTPRRKGGEAHLLSICKDTESGIGWLEMTGVYAQELMQRLRPTGRKIEFIGNSITAGTGMDLSMVPCGQGQWYDQHNAWMSYGALTARALHAEWQLTAVAGIGLIHSCCKMDITMPEVFDKMDGRDNKVNWDFGRYQPDVVTVCLGQNDGVQDSTVFCGAYIRFISQVRHVYPQAQIVLLTSPMGNAKLTAALKNYLGGIVAAATQAGDSRVHSYFFTQQYSHGCGGHPDLEEHGKIAAELTGYVKGLMGW